MHKARYWKSEGEDKVRCLLCPHECLLGEGKSGICRVRRVKDGQLVAAGYGRISSEHVDPIEKKPLARFYPGSWIYSIGGWGCNLACSFCQNWTIAQQFVDAGDELTPEDVVKRAMASGGIGIAYTYNEPLIAFEFVRDCAELARVNGLKNVLVTNGYVNAAPAAELLPFIDAANIDIKSMADEFYVKQCCGHLQPVLDFARQAVESGVHVEITNLLIPELNASDDDVDKLASWIADNLGRTVPLHLSAYYPCYKSNLPPTPPALVYHAREIALKHLDYVYTGNVP